MCALNMSHSAHVLTPRCQFTPRRQSLTTLRRPRYAAGLRTPRTRDAPQTSGRWTRHGRLRRKVVDRHRVGAEPTPPLSAPRTCLAPPTHHRMVHTRLRSPKNRPHTTARPVPSARFDAAEHLPYVPPVTRRLHRSAGDRRDAPGTRRSTEPHRTASTRRVIPDTHRAMEARRDVITSLPRPVVPQLAFPGLAMHRPGFPRCRCSRNRGRRTIAPPSSWRQHITMPPHPRHPRTPVNPALPVIPAPPRPVIPAPVSYTHL